VADFQSSKKHFLSTLTMSIIAEIYLVAVLDRFKRFANVLIFFYLSSSATHRLRRWQKFGTQQPKGKAPEYWNFGFRVYSVNLNQNLKTQNTKSTCYIGYFAVSYIVDDRAVYRESNLASSGLLRMRIILELVYMWSKYQGKLYSTKCPKSDLR
jgi:hypothetical protein